MSAERFSLGGPTGVRAYPVGEALGDTGYVFQAEYRYLIPGFKIAGGDVIALQLLRPGLGADQQGCRCRPPATR